MHLTIIILAGVSAIAKGFCDSIKFQASFPFRSDWWFGKGEYAWNKRTFWTKYIFSFIADGWHCFDAIRVMNLCIAITLCTNLSIIWALVFYIVHGLVFELTYKIL